MSSIYEKIGIDEIRNAVADELEKVGHGNPLFIQSVREGGQDDGPFMRGAIAVYELIHRLETSDEV